MSLAPGVRLGPYEVQSALGAGGMGEVWRARDTKLARDVALKILPEVFARDPDRLARFQREAQVLASLNHPNIAAIHGLEESSGVRALVLELVEGPTLADRIARGTIPLDEALQVAKQIAEALQAAHDHGVIHRDLKPSNIKLRADGTVKVLDFGLAKPVDPTFSASDVSESPTLTSPAFTGVGVILGTAAYMAPEQARGKAVDKRADIWAFGVVLYEMLTGKRPFRGETITDILAAVVGQEPDWSRIPVQTRRLVKACLQKDPSRRLHDIADVKLLMEDEPQAERPRQPRLAWIAAGAFAVAMGVAVWAPWRTPPPAPEPIRTQVYLPENVDAASRNFTLSPDGRVLAFSAVGSDGIPRVWVRLMDSLEVRSLPGTETTQTPPQFFWSPDSRRIAYSAKGGKLNTVDLTGSPPQTLVDTTSPSDRPQAVGGSWNRDGELIFGSLNTALVRVSLSGGAPSPVTALDLSRKETRHAFPTFLPDGRHFLYLRTSATIPENSGVYLGSLDAKPGEQDARRLVATMFGPVYVPSTQRGRGHLLILRDGNVLAQAFDEGRMEIVGDPVTVVQQVGAYVASGFFSASGEVLVYRSSGANQDTRLQWWDREGTTAGTELLGGVRTLAFSPDGERIALVRPDPAGPNADIWIWDTTRGNNSRLMVGPGRVESPVWTPDGLQVVFASNREGPWNLYRKLANVSKQDEVLLKSGQDKTPTSISPDGRLLLYTQTDPQTKKDIWVLSNPGGGPGDRKPTPFQRQQFDESEAQFSPEPEIGATSGPRWVAYTSNESGRNDVYVREFPLNAAGGNWLVSKAGGTNPRWRRDGKELFFAALDGSVMSVDVTPGATFQASEPKLLVRVPSGIRPNWDVTPNGKRFLVLVNVQQAAPFTVWQNWQAGLKR